MARKLLKLSLILLIFIILFFPFQASASTLEDARKMLEKANLALQSKDFIEALKYSQKAFEVAKGDELRAEALYLYGKIAEKAAYNLTNLAFKAVKPRKNGVLYGEDIINWEGLKPYKEIGLKFEYSRLGAYFYYNGDSFRKITQDFANAKWACAASFKLIVIERIDREWSGPQEAEGDVEKLKSFLEKCSQPEVKCEIIYTIARDYMYIASSYQNNLSRFYNPEKAYINKEKAESALNRIIKEYPDSEEAKNAVYHLRELKVESKKRNTLHF